MWEKTAEAGRREAIVKQERNFSLHRSWSFIYCWSCFGFLLTPKFERTNARTHAHRHHRTRTNEIKMNAWWCKMYNTSNKIEKRHEQTGNNCGMDRTAVLRLACVWTERTNEWMNETQCCIMRLHAKAVHSFPTITSLSIVNYRTCLKLLLIFLAPDEFYILCKIRILCVCNSAAYHSMLISIRSFSVFLLNVPYRKHTQMHTVWIFHSMLPVQLLYLCHA